MHFKIHAAQILLSFMMAVWIGGCESTEDGDLRGEHRRIMSKILDDNEISTFRPGLNGDPVDTEVYILLQSFGEINPLSMEYTVDIDFYVSWMDDRLTHNTSDLVFQTVESIKKFWLPDLYFVNEKNGALHTVLSENIALLLKGNGTIVYATRLTLTLSCYMELQLFPLDIQHCMLKVRSYAYNVDHVKLHWTSRKTPISGGDITVPQFEFTHNDTYETVVGMPLGNYSTLTAVFTLERSLGFFIINLFLPSFLLVIISWISFWLHVDATAARASLGITSVLTLVTQSGSIRYMIPSLSYPTAMDLWFTSCIIFVFAALLEFSLVNYFYILSVRASRKELATGVPDHEEDEENENDNQTEMTERGNVNYEFNGPMMLYKGELSSSMSEPTDLRYRAGRDYDVTGKNKDKTKRAKKEAMYRRRAKLFLKIATRIDKTCRFLFPGLFGLFAIIFWIVYPTLRGGDNNLHVHL
ncbi:glycine receptor subunit alphaZ1-like [Ptychodera flava]|uniref:glycine receptor subunit alphaZ1-like n=1 Tax=Ptychodera flava TaxID=63121 RepID=UPI00396A1506